MIANKRNFNITAKQVALVNLVLDGKSYKYAYQKAGYSTNGKGWTDENISGACLKVLHKPVVQEYMKKQQATLDAKAVWTREKSLNALTKIIDKTLEHTTIKDDKTGRELNVNVGSTQTAIKAIETVNKMCGYDKPQELTNDKQNKKPFVFPAALIGKAFVDLNRTIDNDTSINEYWLEGGRGSLKSSYTGAKIIGLIENNPNYCAMGLRKIANTLKDSVFSQLEWAITQLGLENDYKLTKSPLEITKISTGQKIYFRGADEPTKIKSITPPNGMYIAITWFEEFDQINGLNDMRSIDQSTTRGGDRFYRFRTYNTPRSNLHFVNKEKVIPKPGRIIHRGTYLEAPKEWLGKTFIEDAEYLKSVNPDAYDHEYMGAANGTGGMVFENLQIRTITDEEINTIGNFYQGLDWGWSPDPLHWVRVGYHAAKRTLYIVDELRANKMPTLTLFETLRDTNRLGELISADNSNERDNSDLKARGAFIKAVGKFPGSVEYGIKWLASLAAIVIDPARSLAAVKEFSEYELEKDKDGNYISCYPDKNNHSIDATRYAMELVLKRKGQ